MEAKPKQMQFKVRIDDEASRGKYANFVNVWHSNYEFVIDLGQVMPGRNEIRVFDRIITNPLRAKLFWKALEMNIQKYEETFGTIDIERHPLPEGQDIKMH
ncbi:MAG TPA: DUF3467 domain-containing protein [bacterium]|nr:DUF3467 domain-containing protein [bacterium]